MAAASSSDAPLAHRSAAVSVANAADATAKTETKTRAPNAPSRPIGADSRAVANAAVPDDDKIRMTSRSMLQQAMLVDFDDARQASQIAEACEAAIFGRCRVLDVYMQSIRCRYANLKKNPQLRADLRTGLLTPERFALMTAKVRAGAHGCLWPTDCGRVVRGPGAKCGTSARRNS